MFSGNIPTPSNGFNLKVEYSYYQPLGENYTEVTAKGYVKRNNSAYHPYNTTSSVTLNIGGNAKTTTNAYSINVDNYVHLITHTARIQHEADGTKNINITFEVDGKLSNWYPKGSISQDLALPQIRLASNVSLNIDTLEVGDTCTINIDKAAGTNFTHKIEYNFCGDMGVIADNVVESCNWKIPELFYNNLIDYRSQTCTIICTTYNGTQIIGTKSCNIQISCKESDCKPTLTYNIVDENTVTKALTGSQGKAIKHASFLRITASCTPKKGAKITQITCDGTPMEIDRYSGNYFANILIKDPIKSSYIIVATDSRSPTGISTSSTASIEMYDYTHLTCNTTIKRISPTSNSATLKVTGNYYNGSFGNTINSLNIVWKYRLHGTNDWINGGAISEITYNNGTYCAETTCIDIFNYKKNYEVVVAVSDKIENTGVTIPLIAGESIISFSKNRIKIFGEDIIGSIKNSIANMLYPIIYPVNSLKLFYDNDDHSNYLGGTWVRVCQGRVPVGIDGSMDFSYIGQLGGEKYHTLSYEEMPIHTHTMYQVRQYKENGDSPWIRDGAAGYATERGQTVNAGGGRSHNNMQPYEVIAIWRRIN